MKQWPHAADCAACHFRDVTWTDGTVHIEKCITESRCSCHVAEIERLRLALDCELGVRHMTVARLAGKVEGRPTHTGNFLQRIDALREIEKNEKRLRGIIEETAKWLVAREGR